MDVRDPDLGGSDEMTWDSDEESLKRIPFDLRGALAALDLAPRQYQEMFSISPQTMSRDLKNGPEPLRLRRIQHLLAAKRGRDEGMCLLQVRDRRRAFLSGWASPVVREVVCSHVRLLEEEPQFGSILLRNLRDQACEVTFIVRDRGIAYESLNRFLSYARLEAGSGPFRGRVRTILLDREQSKKKLTPDRLFFQPFDLTTFAQFGPVDQDGPPIDRFAGYGLMEVSPQLLFDLAAEPWTTAEHAQSVMVRLPLTVVTHVLSRTHTILDDHDKQNDIPSMSDGVLFDFAQAFETEPIRLGPNWNADFLSHPHDDEEKISPEG